MGSFPPAAGSHPVSPPPSARRVAEARVAFSGRRRQDVTTSKTADEDDASPGQKRKARAVEDIDDDDLEPATSIAPSPPRLTPEEEAELRERRVRDARARAARRVRAVRRAAAASSGAAGDAGEPLQERRYGLAAAVGDADDETLDQVSRRQRRIRRRRSIGHRGHEPRGG